ncbi:MAG: AraC family transcriptional regulator [Ginsengibacter sp.]
MNPDDETPHPFNYSSDKDDLNAWIRDFSKYLKVHPEGGTVIYPESFASGYAKVSEIEPGISYRIVNYTLNNDFEFARQPSKEFYLIIYLYQYENSARLRYTVNDVVIFDGIANRFSTILMTNSQVTQKLELEANSIVRGLTIQLTDEWLKQKIQKGKEADYNYIKSKPIFKFFLNPKSRKILNEIFVENIKSPIPELYMKTRILRVLEGFLENLLGQNNFYDAFPFPDKDYEALLKVEEMLLDNYSLQFPKIENLARMALMSETKLKISFKKAFGMGLHEYFQKNRMHKGRQFIDTGKYSISEVGIMLGYQNLSNFSAAFKKEFGFVPKDHRKSGSLK